MDNPVLMWHREHQRFMRLLDYLDAQMAQFHEGQSPNYELMAEIISYLTDYADRAHHPREDVAFNILAEREPALRPLILRLTQEHRVIEHAGASLRAYLNAILQDVCIKREAVEAAAATYLSYYRQHIDCEEAAILPVAARLLTEADWNAVATAIPAHPDPVFGNKVVGNRYKAIQAQLQQDAPVTA